MPGRSRSNSFKVCAALLAGGAKALVAPQPPRAKATTLRAAMSEPEESPEACRARALTEEFSETKTSDDAVFAELWERVSKSRSDAVRQDRLTASNWRRGAHDRLAAVELEDTRVCQTRLSGRTVAFGTAAGIVVLVDLEAGTVLDGFDAHTDEITALEWAGSEKLISGGADGAVVVYSPSRCGESSLFELVEVDDFEDDFEDDDEDAGVLDSLYDALDALQDGHDADADAALARAALFGGDYYPVPKDDRIIIEHQRDRVDVAEELMGLSEAPESDGEPDVVLRGHSARVTGVRALDAKASKVLSASLDRRVLLWDVEQGDCREVAVAPSAICCLAVADGVAVVGLLDGSVEGYNLEDGARVFRLEDAHEGAVRSVHFGNEGDDEDDAGPRGRLLCTGGADGVVKCYTMRGGADGEPLQPRKADGCPLEAEDVPIHFRGRRSGAHALRGHAGAVVAVQADDTKLVSASIDGSVRCWDLRTGAQLFALDGHSRHITSLHFEGPLLVSDGTGGNVVVHDFSGKVRS